MAQQKTKELIKNTLENPFNLNNFKLFINNLLNKTDFSKNQIIYPEEIGSEFKEHIKSCQLIGEYTDKEDKKINILTVQLNNESSIERARTLQRNFIAKYLKYNPGINSSLVAFFQEDSPDWRFSFVKLEPSLNEKGNIKYEFTPARRYSFLVGKDEFSHTAQSQLAPIIDNEGEIYISDIEECFHVEKVTKEFFEKYKILFKNLTNSIEKLIQKDNKIKLEFSNKDIDFVEFSKKILGQIVFLYFLQKKGWFGIDKDSSGKFKEYGKGDKNFLLKLFFKCQNEKKNFFNDYLEHLFYSALAQDRRADGDQFHLQGENYKIPFLNGGLFEPMGINRGYNWRETDIIIPNEIFFNKEEDGIFNILNLYNFTVKEDEPLEKEVAIDPEMLGKIFEKLGAITQDNFEEYTKIINSKNNSEEMKFNKKNGVYYTPREIVHYMCQQSLINYLETNINIKRDIIERFVLEDCSLNLLNEIKNNKEKIDSLLHKIKVADPAVGSGAFLVGMMSEIVKCRSSLNKNKKIFDLKEECIEESLHGVDISPGAVDICQLRLWLSLIVDEENIDDIKPLPNLDYKIMCGNSLIEEFDGMKLWDDKWLGIKKEKPNKEAQIKELRMQMNELLAEIPKIIHNKTERKQKESKVSKIRKQIEILSKKGDGDNMKLNYSNSEIKLEILNGLMKKFVNTSERTEKVKQKQEIEDAQIELMRAKLKEDGNPQQIKEFEDIIHKKRSKPFFLWKMNFIDVFQREENPGFDVVIANPPYLESRSPEFTRDVKDKLQSMIKKDFPNEYHLIPRGSDLLIYFYIKAIRLISKLGFISFISQNSWLDTDYGTKFQEFIINNTNIRAIVDSDYKYFDTANINTVITFFIGNKTSLDKNNKVYFLRYHNNFEKVDYSFSKIFSNQHSEEDVSSNVFSQNELKELGYKWGIIIYSDKEFLDILKKIKKFGKKIEDIGIACGQGINLTKEYYVDKKITRLVEGKSLIPIMTRGAPYELKKTDYFLIDKDKLTNKQIEDLTDLRIKMFDRKKTTKMPPTLILPRGISRHYCSYNTLKAYSSSAVDIYINKKDREEYDNISKRMWVFLNSSMLWLIREISGRKNLGGGMLKAEATDLKQFELYFDFNVTECQKLFEKFREKEALKTLEEIYTKHHQELDEFVFNYLELSKSQRKYIISKLYQVIKNREEKSSTK